MKAEFIRMPLGNVRRPRIRAARWASSANLRRFRC